MIEIAGLSVLAALIGLDVTAFGQFMVSQPIVCGPLFGYLLGDIKTGLWIGMIVEMIWVKLIPMGAAIPNNVTAIAIFSIYWGVRSGHNSNGVFIFSLALGILFAMAFKPLDVWVRYANVKVVHWVEKSIKNGNENALGYGTIAGIFMFFIRGFIFYFFLLYPGLLIVKYIYPKLPLFVIRGLDISWWLLPVAGLGIMLYSFHNKFAYSKNK